MRPAGQMPESQAELMRELALVGRKCPNCDEDAVPTRGLIVSGTTCRVCHRYVEVKAAYRITFLVLILPITVVTTLAVLVQQGIYAALLWMPFPIAAIGCIKAILCPLQSRQQ